MDGHHISAKKWCQNLKNKAGWGKKKAPTNFGDCWYVLHCIAVFLFLEDFRKGTFTTQREHSVFPNWVEGITPMVRKQLFWGGRCVFFSRGVKSPNICLVEILSHQGFQAPDPEFVVFFFGGGPSWKILGNKSKKCYRSWWDNEHSTGANPSDATVNIAVK